MDRLLREVALFAALGHGLHSGMRGQLLASRVEVQAATEDDAIEA